MARTDVAAAGTVLAFAAGAFYAAGRLPVGTARSPGPGFFPWWISAALGLLAAALLVQALRARAPAGTGDGRTGRPAKVVGLLAVLAAYVALVEPLGYPLCTFLLVVFMLRVVERHRWPLALGVAAACAAGSYALFATWLQVPLPPGPLLR